MIYQHTFSHQCFLRCSIIGVALFLVLSCNIFQNALRGCSYGGELARLSGLARLGEMIFIPRSYGIFCLSSIKKFVMSLKKDYLIKYFLQ